jgi:hypothetical protein
MGNAYNNASLLVTPNGYRASKIYSAKPTDGTGDLAFSRASNSTLYNSQGLIEVVGNNIPRLNYPIGGGCPSWLFEPQATNLVTFSEQFDNDAWSKFNLSVTANSLLSPDGTVNADKIIENTANDNHFVFTAILPSGVYTSSVFAKQGERKNLVLGNASFGVYAVFDLNNGTVVSISGSQLSSPKIESYGNGWYRCSVINTNDDLRTLAIGIADNLGNVSYAGDGTSGLFIWGAQVEVGTVATSYIPTVGSAVTRLADVSTTTSLSALIGQTEGTIYAEVDIKNVTATTRGVLEIRTSGTQTIALLCFSNGNLGAYIINSSDQFVRSITTVAGKYKLALAYSAASTVLYINGQIVGAASSSVSVPPSNAIELGNYGGSVSQLNDGIYAASIYPVRLSNAELAELTTL